MKSNNKLKELSIKNCPCHFLGDIIKLEDFVFDNILINENSYENILVYDISLKILIGVKPLRIRFNKVNGFIRVYDGTKYLVLFGDEKYYFIYSRIRHLMGIKSVVTYVISHNYEKSKLIHTILYL